MSDHVSPDHNQTDFDRLVREAQQAVTSFRDSKSRSLRSLYQALDQAYLIRRRAMAEPERFREFAEAAYRSKRWGRITTATTRNPFTIPVRLIFGNDKDEQPTVARYAKALRYLEERFPDADPPQGRVAALLDEAGGIEALVAKARTVAKKDVAATAEADDENQQAVLRSPVAYSFPAVGGPGLRLLLVHVDGRGNADVLSERSSDEVAEAVRRAASERFLPLSLAPSRGDVARRIRALDRLLPADIAEYREPFVGDGTVFFLLRRTRPANVRYWLNHPDGGWYRFWLQVQSDPEAMLAIAGRIMASMTRHTDREALASELLAQRNGDETLAAAAAVLVCGLWKCAPKRQADSWATNRFSSLAVDIRTAQPLLDGVRITNIDGAECLAAPPSGDHGPNGTFVLFDPLQNDGADQVLNLAQTAVTCRYRWFLPYRADRSSLSAETLANGVAPRGVAFHACDLPAKPGKTGAGETLLANFYPSGTEWRQVISRGLPAGEPRQEPTPGEVADGSGYRRLFG